MKLTQNQKDLLACIKDKKIRKEVKKEFKKKITFYYTRWELLDEVEPIVFENGKLETDHPKIQDFLSQHPMCENSPLNLEPLQRIDLGNGATLFRRKWELLEQPENHNSTIKTGVIYKGKLFDTIEEALGHDFKEKPNQILNRGEKTARGLSEKTIEILLDDCSIEKLTDLVQDGTIELSDMVQAIMRKTNKLANNVEKQFTLEDMRKIYVNGILDNQNLLVTPETCQITFDMHLRNVEKKQ